MEKEDLLNFLGSIHPISPSLRGHLSKIIKRKKVCKNGFLLREGQISDEMCFICKGLLRAFIIKNNKEISMWFMADGDFVVSIMSYYTQSPSDQFIQALKDTELFYIEKKELDDIYERYDEFNYHGRVLENKYYLLWEQRIQSYLLHSAKERYGWLVQYHGALALQVPGKYIASWLAVTPETLSNIKRKIANPN